MRRTAIIGVGMTPVSEHWNRSIRDIASEAVQAAFDDAGISHVPAMFVGNAHATTFNNQSHLGALLADHLRLDGIETYTFDAGDASGGSAIRAAHIAVLSGEIEMALVLGVEKATDIVGASRVRARSTSLDGDYESIHGATQPAMAGLLMRRYMEEYGVSLGQFENFSINAHRNGGKNPKAMYRNQIKPGAFARAAMVADPVNLFDGAPDGDGAAALIICSEQKAHQFTQNPIIISGSSMVTDRFMLQERSEILWLSAVEKSFKQVLEQSKRQPDQLDFMELHDSFTILSTLSLESMGFAERGQGWNYLANNPLPISTFGGLKARGNPVGASGVYQAVEAVMQLRGTAGDNQLSNAKVGLIQNVAGLGNLVVSHILESL